MLTRPSLQLVSSSFVSGARPWFESEAFRSAFQAISRGLEAKAGLVLLSGDEGAGKSVLMRALKEVYARAGRNVLHYDVRELQDPLGALDKEPPGRTAEPLILIFDGGERLSREHLAEIASLRDRDGAGSVQLVLSGRPELCARLQLLDHAESEPHIERSTSLGALRRHEVALYLRYCFLAAGRPDRRFEEAALDRLYAYSGGNPGIISRIGARLDDRADATIGVADINAAIGVPDGRLVGGRLTIAQFGSTTADPSRSRHARPGDGWSKRGVVIVAALIGTAALVVAVWPWIAELESLTYGKRPAALSFAVAETVESPAARQAPAAGMPASVTPELGPQASSERGPVAEVEAEREPSTPVGAGPLPMEVVVLVQPVDAQPPEMQVPAVQTTIDESPAAAERDGFPIGRPEVAERPTTAGNPELNHGPPVLSGLLPGTATLGPSAELSLPATPQPEIGAAAENPVRELPGPPTEKSSSHASVTEPSGDGAPAAQAVLRTHSDPAIQPARPERPSEANAFMRKGLQYLDAGDIASARLFFERAAELGLPEACTAMGETFDPAELRRRGVIGIRGQADIAMKWYRLGDDRGDARARERISSLVQSAR